MKTFLFSTIFIAFSASTFACEYTPPAYEKTEGLVRSLESDAYVSELYQLLQSDEDIDMTGVNFGRNQVKVSFSNNCQVVVTTKWTQTDGGGACPEVKKIVAKTVCK